MGLFDVHAHLTDPRLAPREDELIARARKAGVTTIISNGLNPRDNAATLAVAERHDIVRPALGLYPVDAVLPEMISLGVDYKRDMTFAPPTAEESIAWVEDHIEDAFAVGEIGLDHHWVPQELWDLQERVFRRLVRLAIAADKPIIIHTRKAERRALEVLVEEGATRVDWHCFSSKLKLARKIAEHGHCLSIPANARRAEGFRRMLEKLPREQLLLETDCPYLGPVRGELNEPANVAGTAELAAELWGEPLDAVHRQFEDNFNRLFGCPP